MESPGTETPWSFDCYCKCLESLVKQSKSYISPQLNVRGNENLLDTLLSMCRHMKRPSKKMYLVMYATVLETTLSYNHLSLSSSLFIHISGYYGTTDGATAMCSAKLGMVSCKTSNALAS